MDVIGLIVLAILFWGLSGMFWSYIVTLITLYSLGFGACLLLFGMGSINFWGAGMGIAGLFLGWLFWGRLRYTRIAVSLGVMIFSITIAPLVFAFQAVTTGFVITPHDQWVKDHWENQWVMPDVGFFDLFTNQAYRDYVMVAHPLQMLAYFELCVVLVWFAVLLPAWFTMRQFRHGNELEGTCYGYFNDHAYPDDAKPVRHTFPYFS